jgi:hypothetical protein
LLYLCCKDNAHLAVILFLETSILQWQPVAPFLQQIHRKPADHLPTKTLMPLIAKINMKYMYFFKWHSFILIEP